MDLGTLTDVPAVAAAKQADTIRNTMSVANLLTDPASTPPELANVSLVPAPPSTPPNAVALKLEDPGSSDTIMSNAPVVDGASPGQGEDVDNTGDVDDADREFLCMNDPCGRCQTGQYTKDLSRKVISDHFGRNKACTRDIVDWPLFCRKHYQRATYNKDKWQLRKVELILRQFDIIEAQFSGTTYNINFKKSEETRLNLYSRHVAAGMTNEDAEKLVAPVPGKHFEAPIDVLRELDQWLGKGKTYGEVKRVMDVILQMLEERDCDQVPSVEFLPQLPGKTTQVTPVKVRVAKSPRTPRTSKTPSRVSNKASVKKTSQQA